MEKASVPIPPTFARNVRVQGPGASIPSISPRAMEWATPAAEWCRYRSRMTRDRGSFPSIPDNGTTRLRFRPDPRRLILRAAELSAARSPSAQRSVELQRDVNDAVLALLLGFQTAALQHAQHCRVLRQHLSDELSQASRACQAQEMAQQRAGNSPTLDFIDDREGDLGCARPHDDVARARHDELTSGCVPDGNERNLIDEVDVDERGDFLVA